MKTVIFFFFLLLEVLLLSVLPINETNAEFTSLILIIINTIVIVFFIVQSRAIQCGRIIIISVILKLFILISSYYDLFPIMFTGADSVRFEKQALEIWYYPDLLNNRYGTLYQPFLGYLYLIIGPQRMIAQFVNLLMSTLGLILFDYTLSKLKISPWQYKISVAILALSPVSVILNSVLMRDALVTNFFIYSVCFFILYTQLEKIHYVLVSLLCLMLASAFHSGVFPFIIAILLYVLKENSIKALNAKILCFILVFVGIYMFSDSLFSKFSAIEEGQDEIIERLNDARGGSAYLVGMESDNLFINLLFSPIKAVYLLLSPMLWNIRNIGDIIMILLDSVLYYFLLIRILKYGFKNNSRLQKALILGTLLVVFAFANGTHNSGTAARHRNKILPALCLIYGLNYKKNDETKNFNYSSCL